MACAGNRVSGDQVGQTPRLIGGGFDAVEDNLTVLVFAPAARAVRAACGAGSSRKAMRRTPPSALAAPLAEDGVGVSTAGRRRAAVRSLLTPVDADPPPGGGSACLGLGR